MNVEIDALMLRRLKQLCHPDRHADNDMSVLVMKWLNTLATPAARDSFDSSHAAHEARKSDVRAEMAAAMRRRRDEEASAQARSMYVDQNAWMFGNYGQQSQTSRTQTAGNYSSASPAEMEEIIRKMNEGLGQKDTKL